MTNDREQTACCGLYCGDCLPSPQALFDAAGTLRQQLDDRQFDKYAEYRSTRDRTFAAYPVFREVLDAILTLRCPKTCFHGGGNPRCAIRACVQQKGLEGGWQCEGLETCETLQVLCSAHGGTVRHNLRMIRRHGVEHWSPTRGQHYLWEKSDPPQRGAP
jgi:hypothetical protein